METPSPEWGLVNHHPLTRHLAEIACESVRYQRLGGKVRATNPGYPAGIVGSSESLPLVIGSDPSPLRRGAYSFGGTLAGGPYGGVLPGAFGGDGQLPTVQW